MSRTSSRPQSKPQRLTFDATNHYFSVCTDTKSSKVPDISPDDIVGLWRTLNDGKPICIQGRVIFIDSNKIVYIEELTTNAQYHGHIRNINLITTPNKHVKPAEDILKRDRMSPEKKHHKKTKLSDKPSETQSKDHSTTTNSIPDQSKDYTNSPQDRITKNSAIVHDLVEKASVVILHATAVQKEVDAQTEIEQSSSRALINIPNSDATLVQKISPAQPTFECTGDIISNVLRYLNQHEYLDSFHQSGFDDFEYLFELDESTLNSICIKFIKMKSGHAMKFSMKFHETYRLMMKLMQQ